MGAMKWSEWKVYFEDNRTVPPPPVDDAGIPDDPALRRCLARTFSVFQLGEAGEGRIAKEVWRFSTPNIDDDWRVSLGHWVREEGRHGRILGDCARVLGGKPVAENWTNSLLVHGRRLLGIRLKLLVVLTAEVVGITFYGLLAAALPNSSISLALAFIAGEEVQHLAFHTRFFQAETRTPLRRAVFWAAWAVVGSAAGLVVLVDHKATFRKLGIDRRDAARRFASLLLETGRAVTRPTAAPLKAVQVKS